MISSLPGKASRMLVKLPDLQSDLACVLEAESGKLDIKRRVPGTLLICLPIALLFKLAIMT